MKGKGQRWTSLTSCYRLTPPYALVMLFYAAAMESLGSGPLWKSITVPEAAACRRWWWSNLLYANNYVHGPTGEYAVREGLPCRKKKKRCWKRCRIDVDVPRFSADSAGVDNQFPAWLANYTAFPHDASFCSAPKCMLQSWSLAVDMQQFVLATALLPALLPAPSTRLLRWSACGLAIALLPPFAATLVGGWPPMLVWSARALQNPFAEPMFYALYVPTQFRGAPYVVGVVAGCVLLRLKVCIVPLLVLGLSIPPVC